MDEIIGRDNENNLQITQVILNEQKDIKLLRGFEIDFDNNKKYMRNLIIMIENQFVTLSVANSILIMEELYAFDQGDKNNSFCQIVKKDNVKSLKITLPNDKVIYINKTEARAIVKLFKMSLLGYSMTRLLEFENRQSLESWAYLLKKNGYLTKKNKHSFRLTLTKKLFPKSKL